MSLSLPVTESNLSHGALAHRFDRPLDPLQVFRRFAQRPGCVFFDSAQRHPRLGRYSFLTAEPFQWLGLSSADQEGPPGAQTHSPHDPTLRRTGLFAELELAMQRYRSETLAELPPFQGGLAGLFSYDLNRFLERIPSPRYDEFRLPLLAAGLYDIVFAWDHERQETWLISQGFPELEPRARRRRAAERIQQWLAYLGEDPPHAPRAKPFDRLGRSDLAPTTPVNASGLLSNFSPAAYIDMVAAAIERIRAGEIFQVNLAQRLLYPSELDSVEMYLRLRDENPAPFAGFFRGDGFEILSSSPERFFELRGGHVETRPIKGTRRRSGFPESDLFAGYELQGNEKDRSENVMIVDLLRNDLSRCCETRSIRVRQLCDLEIYGSVLHLVSAIEGRLRGDCGPWDLLRSLFPGGSVTGAPKVRAMQVIAEMEPTARGPYCGSLGYVGFDGAADVNILIRTITAARGWWQFPMGGGIVALSDPRQEYEETWTKAAGVLRSLPQR